MSCSDDKEHSPSEFYYPEQTSDPNATCQGEDNAEQNNNKNSQEKVFSVFFYKSEQIAIQQSHTINLGLYRKVLPTKNLRQYFPIQTSHSVNKFLILYLRYLYNAYCNFFSVVFLFTAFINLRVPN